MKRFISNILDNLSLRNKLILVYTVLVSVIILVIGILTYNISIMQLEESEKNLLLQNLKQTGSLVDFDLEMYLRKGEMIFSNTIIQDTFEKDYRYSDMNEIYDAIKNSIYKNIEPIMQDLVYPELTLKSSETGTGTDFVKVAIYSSNISLPKDGGIINDINDLNNEKWVSVMNINSKKPYWRGVFKNGDKTYISVNRVLVSFKNLKQLGVMSIMIPELRLKYLLSQNNEKNNASIYLIDNENKVVAQKTDNEMLSKTKEINELSHANFEDEEGIKYSNIGGQKYILAYTTSNITGWKFMALYPYKAITKRVEAIKYAVAILLLIGIIISTIITIFMAYATTRRLNKMRKKMNTLKNNRLAKLEVIYGNDEIGNLDRTFNDMINRINELIEHEDDFQLQKARLQVELLQSQINPHILYNTLATIQWRAKKEGVEDVGIVVERLIRFFKHFLNNGEIISRIEHEMDMITQYIDILKFTYSMSFDCVISLKDDVNKYLSLNMFLQPIVENAIIHGLRPSEKPSKLEIYGSIKDEKILFIVKDNGIGIDSEMVDKINKGEILKNKGGYGISNVVKRIQLYFGEEYGLKITSEAEIGTEVTLTLPANITEEQEQLFKPVI